MEKNINKQEIENKEQELNEVELKEVSGGFFVPPDAPVVEPPFIEIPVDYL